MLLYYITDRKQFGATEAERKRGLLAQIGRAAAAGVDHIQVREKDLPVRDLEDLCRAALKLARQANPRTKILVNSRIDVALACGLDGVHLRSGESELDAGTARATLARTARHHHPVVAVSCHTHQQVLRAWSDGADFVVFGPIFDKAGQSIPSGLSDLRQALALPELSPNTENIPGAGFPVLALGGLTPENAHLCLDAGAGGIAGIRLFQGEDVENVVRRLQSL